MRCKNYIRIFTLFSKHEIELLETGANIITSFADLAKALAKDITMFIQSGF